MGTLRHKEIIKSETRISQSKLGITTLQYKIKLTTPFRFNEIVKSETRTPSTKTVHKTRRMNNDNNYH
jgi:hypothetical protein